MVNMVKGFTAQYMVPQHTWKLVRDLETSKGPTESESEFSHIHQVINLRVTNLVTSDLELSNFGICV